MTWYRLRVQCCTLMIWPKACMCDGSQSAWTKQLRHIQASQRSVAQTVAWTRCFFFPSRWLSSHGEIEAKTRSVAVTWRWQGIGDKLWPSPFHCLLFFYVINTVDTLGAATWWHTNTATMSMCFYDIMISGTITFKVCKKKSIIYQK